jgi:hypothetical protein
MTGIEPAYSAWEAVSLSATAEVAGAGEQSAVRVAYGRGVDAEGSQAQTTGWLAPAILPLNCYNIGAPSRTRTDTVRILSPLPLPIGL